MAELTATELHKAKKMTPENFYRKQKMFLSKTFLPKNIEKDFSFR